MILNKLHEALAEVDSQRKALDNIERQLRSMIAELSGQSFIANAVFTSTGLSAGTPTGERNRLDDIADILRAAGKPLHISLIAVRLSDKLGRKIERASFEPGLNRHIQKTKKRRIDKFGPSTYGLPEWKNQPALAHIA